MAYVRYLNEREVVSASTDSTLRLWNVDQQAAARVYEGHVNEKNFVGLSADGEFIACGSELNEVWLEHPKILIVKQCRGNSSALVFKGLTVEAFELRSHPLSYNLCEVMECGSKLNECGLESLV